VNDADAIASRAKELGATIAVEPFDVPGTARMSVIRDPAGAAVGLWQPEGFSGARLVNEIGTWTWNELGTSDVDSAKAFYSELFGWAANDLPAPIRRASFTLGDLLVAGVHALTEQEAGAPPSWTVSFRVADADQSVEKVRRLGGTILLSPMDVPVGRFSVVADPAGAVFTVAAVPSGAFRGLDGS
jgi:predicted enzyme related to lactoylglutathione lyase